MRRTRVALGVLAALLVPVACGGDDGGAAKVTTTAPVELEAFDGHPAGFITLDLPPDWKVPEYDGTERFGTEPYTEVDVEKVLKAQHPVQQLAGLTIYRQRDVGAAPALDAWAAAVAQSLGAAGVTFGSPTPDQVGGRPALRMVSTEPDGTVVAYPIVVGDEHLVVVLEYSPTAKDGLKAVGEAAVDTIQFDLTALG